MLRKPGDAVTSRLEDAGDPEVGKDDAVGVPLPNYIGGLHVPVDDAILMGCRQRGGHLAQNVARLLDLHHALRLQGVREIPSLDVLHDDEGGLVVQGTHAVHRGHVVVVDLGCGPSFPLETLPCGLVSGELGLHDLDGHHASEVLFSGEEHVSHGTLPQKTYDLEVGGQLGLEFSLTLLVSHVFVSVAKKSLLSGGI